ncbi:MAG: transposase, partial [Desulfobacterales bacterium]|nr:transposase [Desulfobacterales bacterium]
MPRQARLDAPGLLQHVIARGIERREIFKDDQDRESFLDRLAVILEETQTQCHVWALFPNHFHLLLRTGATPLGNVMRRRKNPLIPKLEKEVSSADKRIAFFRFRPETEKARINPENPVNPVCPVEFENHSTGVKNKLLAEKTIEDVLLHFGDSRTVARRRYRHFVKNGIDQGTRPELQGGGLVRSAGGDKRGLLGRKKDEMELSDERIL